MIALDIDGVICDSIAMLSTVIRYSYGYNLEDFANSYNIKIPDLPIDIGALFEDTILTFNHAIKPYSDAQSAIHLLINNIEYPLIFITARRDSLKELTKEWLIEWFYLSPDMFSVIHREEKLIYIKNSGISYFVEDRLKTANLISNINSIRKSYLVNRQWNVGRGINNKVERKDNLLACVVDYLATRGKNER